MSAVARIPADADRLFSRASVEDFLFEEAACLDEWRLNDWIALFTNDCVYEIPAPDLPDGDPALTFSLVHDSRAVLEQRVIRMLKPTAHAESPRSRTRRIVGNVRVLEETADSAHATANFLCHRSRGTSEATYAGRIDYRLARIDGAIKIRHRKVVLDHETLHSQGKISILL